MSEVLAPDGSVLGYTRGTPASCAHAEAVCAAIRADVLAALPPTGRVVVDGSRLVVGCRVDGRAYEMAINVPETATADDVRRNVLEGLAVSDVMARKPAEASAS